MPKDKSNEDILRVIKLVASQLIKAHYQVDKT
jgi:hypothetical protein